MAYRDHPGVQDIFWAPAIRAGKSTGRMSLRFNVKRKKPERLLRPGERIPSKLSGFRTDITDYSFTHQVRNEPAYDFVRPLMGGVQLQSPRSAGPADWGTLGIIRQFGEFYYAISNQHVLDRPAWEYGEAFSSGTVLQPKSQLGGEGIGLLTPIGDNRLDYRLFRMDKQHDLQQSVNGIAGVAEGYRMPSGPGRRVLVKSGAASGVTRGVYDGRSLVDPFRVLLRSIDGTVICRPGDSGSLWMDESSGLKLFALHTAGDQGGLVAMATLYSSIHASVWQQIRREAYKNQL